VRLHVAVDEAGGVGVCQAVAGLHRQRDPLGRRERAAAFERRPLDVLHHDVRPAAVGLACVEDGDDVRVRESRCQPRLAEESPPERGVAGEALREQLHRHLPVELGVVCEVHRGHAAVAERPLEPVAAATDAGRTHAGEFYPRCKFFRRSHSC